MKFKNFFIDNINILISCLGAFLCIFFISYFNSIDETNIWLIPPFGASLVLVMAVHDSPLAQPRNVFFGHILSASSGVLMFYLLGNSPISISLALSFAIFLMIIPIIAILGAKTIEFVIMPVATGALFIVIFAFVYNKILKR